MPLHGKIVVIKRSGGDGTEFPLTASCLFGRKPDCDIRIQLPQVSKEHCRIDLNENKEVILTNLSSVNPTRVNGEALQQSERLKDGDVITIIDRSFRFEYPPAPTPKKRSSTSGKTEKLKVLQDQQVGDVITETGENVKSEVSTDPHLKDGTNNDNIQRSLERAFDVESKEEDTSQSKTISPFSDLYQMIKQSLDAKTPRKSASSLLQTPTSRFYTPKPGSARKDDGKPVVSSAIESTPKRVDDEVSSLATVTESDAEIKTTPESAEMQRRSLQGSASEMPDLLSEEKPAKQSAKSGATPAQKRVRASPRRFSVTEVIEIVTAEKLMTPTRRRSKEATPVKSAVSESKQEHPPEASPKVTEKKPKDQDVPTDMATARTCNTRRRKSGELSHDSPEQQTKTKRVSFGGHLSPELFDKRLPPNSPLRKGARPRRSLCLSKRKQSALRRASVIGLVKEEDQAHNSPKGQSPAQKKTQTPKQSARAKSPSPSPGKKSPKSKTPSPETPSPARGKAPSKDKLETPKVLPKPTASVQAPLVSKETPTVKRRSATTPAKTPAQIQTQGRFSVSRISTPSPTAQEDAVVDPAPSVAVTPKPPLRRMSMKSTSRKTPGMASAAKVMRKSGISRASMKVKNSWADIVKFGPTKFQVAAPSKKAATAKTTKKAAPKMQTPARKIQGHVSTGHADSPVTIVVGKAHKQKVIYPAGAAPRLVTNTTVVKKNMKMDEDLTGVAEIFQTPVNERSRKSVIDDQSSTPPGAPATPAVEASLLKTPEEPGEMVVSPLTVVSAVKYSSEAVKRLLHGDEESFVGEIPSLQIPCDEPNEQQCTDSETPGLTTPKQKPEVPECLTGVKRITRTPRQKSEPREDLRGKILKTPKQKNEPVEDLRGKLLATPKQKPEQPECLTGVKRIFNTPTQNAKSVEDPQGNVLETPKAPEVADVSFDGVKELPETPTHKQESAEDLAEVTDNLKTPDVKSSPPACLTGIKRMMKTPKERNAAVEDMVGVKRLMMTPTEKGKPVEQNFGIKRLMQSPRVKGNPPVEDFEGLQELMEEPSEPTAQVETNEGEDQAPLYCGSDEVKDLHIVCEEEQRDVVLCAHSEDGPSDIMDDVPQDVTANVSEADAEVIEVDRDEKLEEAPSSGENEYESSDVMEIISQTAEEENVPEVVCDEKLPSGGQDECESSDVVEIISQTAEEEIVPEEQPEVEAEGKITEIDAANVDPDTQKKSGRGRRAKIVESKPVNQQEAAERSEDPVVVAPVRGRRGKKMEAAAPPAVRQTTRGRKPKANESKDAELTLEASEPAPSREAVKPRRGRYAKKASDDQTETAEEVMTEAPSVPSLPVDASLDANDSAAPQEEAASKPKKGRKAKQAPVEQTQLAPEQQDVRGADGEAQPAENTANPPQADQEEDANEVCDEKPEEVPSGHKENESDAVETAPQVVVDESAPEEDAASVDANAQKKSIRGKQAQTAESKADGDKLQAAEHPEEPIVAPVRGRRGKKTEASAPPPVRQTTRGRKAKCNEAKDAELTQEAGEPAPSRDAVKPRRGRNAKKASDDQAETAAEVMTEAPSVPSLPVDASLEANDSAAPQEEAASKPKRGRKAKQASVEQTRPAPEQQDVPGAEGEAQPADSTANPPQADQKEDANDVCGEKLEDVPSGHEENELYAVETAPQAAVDESAPEEDAADVDANTQKKSIRGRKAQTAESKADGDKREAAEHREEPIVAPVRGRRGKKTEASAPPPVRQTTRGRKAKCNEATDAELTQEQSDAAAAPKPKRGRNAKQSSDDQAETAPEVPAETKSVPEISAESDQTPSVNATPEEENDSSPLDEAVSKPKRGRKTKQASVEQPAAEATEIVSDQPQQLVVATEMQKPRRGRKAKNDSLEQNEVAVECAAATQQARAPTRATRGRNAKQEEETNPDDDATLPVKTTKSQKPVEKSRGTRKAEKDAVESTEAEVQMAETPDLENTEVSDVASKAKGKEAPTSSEEIPAEPESSAPTAETVTVNEPAPAVVAERPRRRGRPRKQEAVCVAPVESSEAQENPIIKPKRGRGRQNVLEDIAEASEEKPEQVQEAEESKDAEAPVSKPSRARGAKASAKNVDSEVIPPKRVCRGPRSVLQEASVTADSVEMPVAPPRRGRRAPTKPTNDTQEVLSAEKPSEDNVNAELVPAEVKKTVKWNAECQVFEITNLTPVKATRGRKAKLADQDALQGAPAKRGCRGGTESASAEAQNEKGNATEEKDLSGKTGSEPIRRARRGAKAPEADEEPKTLPERRRGDVAQVKAETQTVTRKRSAKK